MKDSPKRAKDFRDRAEELRTIRESWVDEATKNVLGEIAADYDRMAEYIERKNSHAGVRSGVGPNTT